MRTRFEKSRRGPVLRRLAALAAAVAAIAIGCGDNPQDALLGPTGGTDNSCISDFNTIQMVGDFTEPAWTIPASPFMELRAGCVWTTVVRFGSAGDHVFKFVTNEAFDNPPDFGWNESQALRVGVDNPVLSVSGTGTGIKLTIPVAGCYVVKLYEKDLFFRADPTNCAAGGVRGRVEFENASQPPYPRVRVSALQTGIPAGADSTEAGDGTYEIPGLAAGTYDLAFKAFGYLDTTLAGITVGDVVTEAPTVRLRAGCVSAYDSIFVAGQFTTPPFDLGVSPVMEQVEGCRWEADVDIPRADTYLFKFVTPPGFDQPSDYGGSETTLLDIDSTYAVQEVSGGSGNALKMYFPFPGRFRFVLDEETRTFRVESGGIAGDLTGVLVFEGRTAQPLPVAQVELLDNGTPAASTGSSAADGSFRFASVDGGVYGLRVVPPLRAPSHRDTIVTGVTVAGGLTNVGQVFLRNATGGLAGTVSFSNVPAAPFPVAAVAVRRAGALADSLVTTSAAATFRSRGLKPGLYEVSVDAPGYIDTTFSVDVATSELALGTIPLRALVCPGYPTIATLQLGGREINNSPDDLTFSWNLGRAPVAEHVDLCAWQVSVPCAFVAEYRIKFIANGDFGGDPPDFGGDNTTVYPPDSTVTVTPTAAPGIGDALLIRIENPGVYRFDLDLERLEFRYTRTGDLPPGVRSLAQRVGRRIPMLRGR